MSLETDVTHIERHTQARAEQPVFGWPGFDWNAAEVSGAWSQKRSSAGIAASDRTNGEPAIFKDGLFVAPLLLALQAAAPALVAVTLLYGLTRFYNVEFDAPFVTLAVLTAALSFVFLPPRTVVSRLLTSKLALASGLCARWGTMLAVLLAIGYLTKYSAEYSRRVLITWSMLTPALLTGVVLVLQELVRRLMVVPANARSVVFVGCNEMSLALAERLGSHAELCMSVTGFFDDRSRVRLGEHGRVRLLGKLGELPDFVRARSIDAIFIALPLRDVRRVQQLLAQLQDTTASVYYMPDVPVSDPIQARPCELLGMPIVALCETPFYGCRSVIKRLMDIAISAAALVLLAPLLFVVALAIKLSSPGPVLFKQRRYGLNGQQILVYKFRTMTVTEDGDHIRQATREDSRTTPVGRFLRRFSLDELPQLINVLQGRMSLVGPRPHAVAHNEEYRRLIRGYMIRHKVLPGITGLAQINGFRGEIARLDELQARVDCDLEYLRQWSPLLDLKILLLTIPRILTTDKAY